MQYFGDNFATLGQNMDISEHDAPVLLQVTHKLAADYFLYKWTSGLGKKLVHFHIEPKLISKVKHR